MATIGTGVRRLVDLRDPWAGALPKIWDSDLRLGSRTFRALSPILERLALKTADGVITNTSQLAEALAARYPDVPFVYVPNGVDPESFPPPVSRPYPGLGVAHAGTLYAGRDLEPVVRALRIFLDRHPDAARAGSKLRIAGVVEAGHARVFYRAVAAAGMESHVEVLGRLPRAQALTMLSRSRLAVVLAQHQEHQIPAKLYESVAMGVPTLVVAPAGSATAVAGDRLGAMVRDSGDVDGIACVLEHLWRNGLRERSPCPLPITYEAIAPQVDRVLRGVLSAG
jgi:glycosyltransferase involved in cell wall biosynthesis